MVIFCRWLAAPTPRTMFCKKLILSFGNSRLSSSPGSNFKAWSFRIAHFQYMAYRQKRLREKVLFSDELISKLATEAKEVDDSFEQRSMLLERCLERMPARSREMIRLRYADELNVNQMAEKLQRKSNAIYQILFRARRWLIDCVQKDTLPKAT